MRISDWSSDVCSSDLDRLGTLFAVSLGRMHDVPVGPHPQAMFQIAFAPEALPHVLPWLALNRGGLAVLVHPDTGDDLADHRDHAVWMGAVLPRNLSRLPHPERTETGRAPCREGGCRCG